MGQPRVLEKEEGETKGCEGRKGEDEDGNEREREQGRRDPFGFGGGLSDRLLHTSRPPY